MFDPGPKIAAAGCGCEPCKSAAVFGATLIDAAIADGLAGCGITGGLLCRHIEPGALHHGQPGRLLRGGEVCPLLDGLDPAGVAAHIRRECGSGSSDPQRIVRQIVRAEGIAAAARRRFAENAAGQHDGRPLFGYQHAAREGEV